MVRYIERHMFGIINDNIVIAIKYHIKVEFQDGFVKRLVTTDMVNISLGFAAIMEMLRSQQREI